MDLAIEQRQERVLQLLHQFGQVKVSELSKLFDISEVTVRTDLENLERMGQLKRVYGGAILNSKNYYNMSMQQREHTNEAEKQRIAKALCRLIQDDDTIMMNSGTTSMCALRALSGFKNLHIVTNSVTLALEAGTNPNMHVVLLGGSFNVNYCFTYGIEAEKQLDSYHFDKAILSIDGVSVRGGLSTYYREEAELCRKMIKCSDKTIILADYSKIGRCAFVRVADVQAADTIVTNDRPNDELASLKEEGVDMILS